MNEIALTDLIEKIDVYAKQVLKTSRYAHSVRVAEYAARLAEIYCNENISVKSAYAAGLAHDICKNLSDDEILKIVKDDGFGIDAIEKEKPNLLHGRAAAVILKDKFGVNDKSFLDAIAFHTFGCENIDSLGKIIYIADKIEPGRPDTEDFRNFAETESLNNLMLKIIKWRNAYVLQNGGTVHILTRKMYEHLVLNKNKEK